MGKTRTARSAAYRVWITTYDDWTPPDCRAVPPEATAVEPAEEGTLTAAQSARYVESFNRAALSAGRKTWAVALPVTLRYHGEPQPGAHLLRGRASSHENNRGSRG